MMVRLIVRREWRDNPDEDDTNIFLFATVPEALTAQRLVAYMAEPFLEEMVCTTEVRV